MKRFKKVGDGYTLETAARAQETDLLCDQCGVDNCSVRMIAKRLESNRFGANIAVTFCRSFVPSLQFRDDAGLDGEFNTFRLGQAWMKRVEPGSTVALNGPKGLLGFAEVLDVRAGKFPEMNAEYGVDNHLSIDAELNGKTIDLEGVMLQCYGKHRFDPKTSMVTVIDLKRINGSC